MKTGKAIVITLALLLSSVFAAGEVVAESAPVLRAQDKFNFTGSNPVGKPPLEKVSDKKAVQIKMDLPIAETVSQPTEKSEPVNERPAIKIAKSDARPYKSLGSNPLLRGGLNEENALSLDFDKIEKRFGLPEGAGAEIKDALGVMAAKGRFNIVWVAAKYVDGEPLIQYPKLMERGYRVTENRAPTWEGKEPAVEIPLKSGVIIHILLECGNPGIFSPPVITPIKPQAPTPLAPSPLQPVMPPRTEAPKLTRENKFKLVLDADLWGGVGMYENLRKNKGTNNKGYYWWWRTHLLPLGYQWNEKTSVHVGGYVFAAGGAGKSGNYRYSWNEIFVGPAIKLYLENRDGGIDVGVGGLHNRGFEKLYRSRQFEKAFEVNLHYNDYSRKANGHKVLPEIEANMQIRSAIGNPVHTHSWNGVPLTPKATNNNFIDFTVLAHLYDLKVNKHLSLMPGLSLSLGRDFGVQENYIKIGPAITLKSHEEKLAIIYPYNLKFQGKGGDQKHLISLSVSADALVKALYKANTKEVKGSQTPDGYQGSVLINRLNNPKKKNSVVPPVESEQVKTQSVSYEVPVSQGSVLLKKSNSKPQAQNQKAAEKVIPESPKSNSVELISAATPY